MSHIIDCDADPICPEGWKVVKHQRAGQVVWNKEQIELYLVEQERLRSLLGDSQLYPMFRMECMMNANILDFLLAHPDQIPERLNGAHFEGTAYLLPNGYAYVRYLQKLQDGSWRSVHACSPENDRYR